MQARNFTELDPFAIAPLKYTKSARYTSKRPYYFAVYIALPWGEGKNVPTGFTAQIMTCIPGAEAGLSVILSEYLL